MAPRHHLRWPLVACIAGCSVALWPSEATAYERQWRVGAHAGYAHLLESGEPHPGWGGGAHMGYGLTDAYNLIAEVDVTGHFASAAAPGPTVFDASAGAAYTFDVLRWVPWIGVMGGLYAVAQPDVAVDFRPGVSLPIGLDYQIDPHWTVGGQARPHWIVDPQPFTSSAYLTVMVRAEYVWGF